MRYLVTYDLIGPGKGPDRFTTMMEGTVTAWWEQLNTYAKLHNYKTVIVLNSERVVEDTWATH